MAHTFISVKGAKQGQFKGEAPQVTRKDKWMEVLSFAMDLKSPRDPATGLPTGKRQFAPVTVVKAWGAASPQGLSACATNEALTEVVIEFTRTKPTGEEYVHQTVKLIEATIAEAARFKGVPDAGWGTAAATAMELERWSFTFAKIEVQDGDGGTLFVDSWAGST